ncbi:MAG TPA: hypothetical protein VME21_04290, partial [Steroidobacteraceae bacterium]|nr:hypothetical protein [Steroidobacteraceae bacterium]
MAGFPTPSRAQSAAERAERSARDRQLMMDRLGIQALRAPPSADPTAPHPANYEESRANPYPLWPDPLVMAGGRPVSTAALWRMARRPQIVAAFEQEVYGRVPDHVPAIRWVSDTSETERIGRVSVSASRIIGHVDNSIDPAIGVDIPLILIKPLAATAPMPVLIMYVLGRPAFPAPAPPSADEIARLNAALRQSLERQDPGVSQILRDHPAWQPIPTPPFFAPARPPSDPLLQLVADGWAVALLDPT